MKIGWYNEDEARQMVNINPLKKVHLREQDAPCWGPNEDWVVLKLLLLSLIYIGWFE